MPPFCRAVEHPRLRRSMMQAGDARALLSEGGSRGPMSRAGTAPARLCGGSALATAPLRSEAVVRRVGVPEPPAPVTHGDLGDGPGPTSARTRARRPVHPRSHHAQDYLGIEAVRAMEWPLGARFCNMRVGTAKLGGVCDARGAHTHKHTGAHLYPCSSAWEGVRRIWKCLTPALKPRRPLRARDAFGQGKLARGALRLSALVD